MSYKVFLSIVEIMGLLVALYFLQDSLRAIIHLRIAGLLIREGQSEEEARARSGSNHWKQPFRVRIWRKYPPLPDGFWRELLRRGKPL